MGKRIALLVPRLFYGGAEKIAADMSIFLKEKGYDVYIFLDEYDKRKIYDYAGKIVKIHTVSFWQDGAMIKQYYNYRKRAKVFRKLKKLYKIDISISFMNEDNLINIMSDVGEKKYLTVHCVISNTVECQGKIFGNKNIIKHFYSKADRVIAVSNYVKYDLIRNYHVSEKKIEVIYNTVNKDKLLLDRQDISNIEGNDSTVVFIGRLDDEKRPWIAVRVISYVKAFIPDVKLLMIGDGRNFNFLKKLIKNFDLQNNISLLGYQKNVSKYIAHSRALLLCSRSEALPCVIEEALTLGVPVISNDCPGGVCELLRFNIKNRKRSKNKNTVMDCGIMTPSREITKQMAYNTVLYEEEIKFAEAIIELIQNKKLHDKLSENAIKKSEWFEKEKIVEQWLRLL